MARQAKSLFAFQVVMIMLALAGCSRVPGGTSLSETPITLDGSDQVNQIINGTDAKGTEAWANSTVGIGMKNENGYTVNCTATLINENTIVTAAHCVLHMSTVAYVFFGINQTGAQVEGRKITRRLANDKFTPWFPEDTRDVFDIGIAQFEGSLPTGYRPAEILPSDAVLANGAEVLLAGYGVNVGHVQTGAGTLRFTTVKIHDNKYGATEVDTDEASSGSCNGDSGGPAFISVDGKYYLWGTTSRGDSECAKQGVYTKVTSYRAWIDKGLDLWKQEGPAPETESATASALAFY